MSRFRYIEVNDLRIIQQVLQVYENKMKKTGTYIPTTIIGAMNRFNLELSDIELEINICDKCGSVTK